MSNVIWFSNKTNSVGRTIDTNTHARLKDAVSAIGESGYVERQEWSRDGKAVESQLIHTVVNFLPSASELAALRERITVPFPKFGL